MTASPTAINTSNPATAITQPATSATPLPEQPALEGALEDADVCILGAGYTGLSAALDLAEAGYRVVVLEAQRIGWGASGRNGGQAIVGYVILRGGNDASQELGNEIREHVGNKLGKIARPKTVIIVPDLPKTRSGKIMRRLLRDVADGRQLGDTTTLADPGVVAEIASRAADEDDD
mgnify:CR=1 FL=1